MYYLNPKIYKLHSHLSNSYSTFKIANSVAITVLKGSRVDLVVDGGLPPGQDLSAVGDSKEKHGNVTQALHVVGFSRLMALTAVTAHCEINLRTAGSESGRVRSADSP